RRPVTRAGGRDRRAAASARRLRPGDASGGARRAGVPGACRTAVSAGHGCDLPARPDPTQQAKEIVCMLIHALLLAIGWLLRASLLLLGMGRQLGGPSTVGSLALLLAVETAGAFALQLPGGELVACLALSSLLGLLVIRAFPDWNPAGHAAWLFLAEAA